MNEMTLLVNAARVDPILRDAALAVEKRLLAAERREAELERAFHNECAKNDELSWKRDESDREATDAATKTAELEAALRRVRDIATRGAGPDTTADEALATIAQYVTLRFAALAGDGGGA